MLIIAMRQMKKRTMEGKRDEKQRGIRYPLRAILSPLGVQTSGRGEEVEEEMNKWREKKMK